MGIENEAVEVHLFKRNFASDIEAHHNHAGDPGEEDVRGGFHDIERIIRSRILFGPAGTNDWPVRAREPSVKGILVADVSNTGLFNFFKVGTTIKNPVRLIGSFRVGFSKHRDGDAPRDLARNVPIFEVFEVIDDNFLLAFWIKLNFVVVEMLDSDSGEFFDVNKPLFFEGGLKNGAAFVTVGNRVGESLFAS